MHIAGCTLTGGYSGFDIYKDLIHKNWFGVLCGRRTIAFATERELFEAIDKERK